MKYITVKLTEDQLLEVLRGLDDRIENLTTAEIPTKTLVAFDERLLAKLEKEYAKAKNLA